MRSHNEEDVDVCVSDQGPWSDVVTITIGCTFLSCGLIAPHAATPHSAAEHARLRHQPQPLSV